MSAANICLLGIHPLIITLKSISLMIILKLRLTRLTVPSAWILTNKKRPAATERSEQIQMEF